MRIILLILTLFVFVQLSWGQTTYQAAVDQIISEKKTDKLDVFLNEQKDNPDYAQIEQYILEKVKTLVLKKEYNYARSILEIILKNNFENIEAQDYFLSIENLKDEEKIIQARKEEKKQEELNKKAMEELKKARNVSFKSFSFVFGFGALDFLYYQSQFYNDFYNEQKNNFLYGINTYFNFYFNHPYISTGLELNFDVYPAAMNPAGAGIPIDFKAVLGLGFPIMRIPLYLQGGFSTLYFYFQNNQTRDVFVTNNFGPLFGLRVKDYYFNKYVGIDGGFNLHLIAFFTSYYDVAFDLYLGFLCRVYQNKDLKLYIRSEIISFILLGYSKIENNVKFQTSLGISINEK